MRIIADKHKFVIPISCYREAVRGIGWTSYEIRKKLREWGFPEPKPSYLSRGHEKVPRKVWRE